MHKDVLLFIDNIFRYVQAGNEVSALLGRMPSAVGYQPTLAERAGRARRSASPPPTDGSITSVQAIYVPADDLTDPAPATIFSHLDATTVLSRQIVGDGHLSRRSARWSPTPASWTPPLWARSTTRWPGGCRTCLQRYQRAAATSSPFWAWMSCRDEDRKIVVRGPGSIQQSSARSPSSWRRPSPACRAAMCPWRIRSTVLRRHRGRRGGRFARAAPSSWWATSTKHTEKAKEMQ